MTSDLQLAELIRSVRGGAEVFAVHYACESFYEALDRPAGVSAISVASVPRSENLTFSRRDTADPDVAEIALLTHFMEWLRSKPDARLVHWDMNKSEYGFEAIRGRYSYLGGAGAVTHARERLFNLDELIAYRHGRDYARHPRLPTISQLNAVNTRYTLSGTEQAARFAAGEHGELARCTSERAGVIAELTELFVAGRLQTERSGPAVQFAGALIDSVDLVLEIGGRIRAVGRELGRRRTGKPTIAIEDEYDYQDLLRAELRLFFGDVRAEDVAPQVAGSASRIDFVLPDVSLAVELKAARESLSVGRIGEELIVDVRRYEAHPSVRHLVCLVFDFDGLLVNPRSLETDLSGSRGSLAVTVRVFQ